MTVFWCLQHIKLISTPGPWCLLILCLGLFSLTSSLICFFLYVSTQMFTAQKDLLVLCRPRKFLPASHSYCLSKTLFCDLLSKPMFACRLVLYCLPKLGQLSMRVASSILSSDMHDLWQMIYQIFMSEPKYEKQLNLLARNCSLKVRVERTWMMKRPCLYFLLPALSATRHI